MKGTPRPLRRRCAPAQTRHGAVAVLAGQRMNDGICDRLGQFVVGSMIARREDRAAADASLYRLGRSGRLETLLEGGIAVSNGPCFSPLCANAGGLPILCH